MYGAILGDMIGLPYEFDQGDKTKDFELFDKRKRIRYTDDSAMTIAIAKAIIMDPGDSPGGPKWTPGAGRPKPERGSKSPLNLPPEMPIKIMSHGRTHSNLQ